MITSIRRSDPSLFFSVIERYLRQHLEFLQQTYVSAVRQEALLSLHGFQGVLDH